MSHGIYVDWNPIFDLAIRKSIPIIRWQVGFKKEHIFIKHASKEDTRNIYYLSDSTWKKINKNILNDDQKKRLDMYMKERYSGAKNNIYFFESPDEPEKLYEQLDLPKDKPIWGIFPHLSWDAVFCFEEMLFNNPIEWIIETARAISKIEDINWIIKIHPAERIYGTQVGVQEVLSKVYPYLPKHIRIIPAESHINTYRLFKILDGGITIWGTTGLELCITGKPVILAGQAHYGTKGFTCDCQTKEVYFRTLKNTKSIGKLNYNQIERAKRYAYAYFIEKQIPFNWVTGGTYGEKSEIQLHFSSFEDLTSGKDQILDMICERIIHGGEFLLDKKAFKHGYIKTINKYKSSSRSFDQNTLIGEQLYNKGDYAGALYPFLKALEKGKNYKEAYNNLGVCYWRLGDYFSALRHFSKALEMGYDASIIENCNQVFKSINKIKAQGEWALMYKIFYLMSVSNKLSDITNCNQS
jgi:tetratricopeptide (TPR) repeat protein